MFTLFLSLLYCIKIVIVIIPEVRKCNLINTLYFSISRLICCNTVNYTRYRAIV
nr:MAG TPA: hypothetical protein [Caudoviricetes sp.]